MGLPQLLDGRWHVSTPLAWDTQPDNEEDLRQLVADVLHGLAALHGLGIVHRDVRPSNILQVTPHHALSLKQLPMQQGQPCPCTNSQVSRAFLQRLCASK